MARKKYKITTLIKVAVISYFYITMYEHPFLSSDPKYDRLKRTIYNTLKLCLMALFIIFILSVLPVGNGIQQVCFIIYGLIIAYGFLFGIIEFFKIWRFFFRERLEKEDAQE